MRDPLDAEPQALGPSEDAAASHQNHKPQRQSEQEVLDIESQQILIDNDALPALPEPPSLYNPNLGKDVCARWEELYGKGSAAQKVIRTSRIKKYGFEVANRHSPGSTPDEARRDWERQAARSREEEDEKLQQCLSEDEDDLGGGQKSLADKCVDAAELKGKMSQYS